MGVRHRQIPLNWPVDPVAAIPGDKTVFQGFNNVLALKIRSALFGFSVGRGLAERESPDQQHDADDNFQGC